MSPSRVLIIGYGNPLRRDDGVGWQAAEQLAQRLNGNAEVLACHQLTPELAETCSRATELILIDASVTGRPGDLVIKTLEPVAVNGQSFTHHFSARQLLAITHTLYGHSPHTRLCTITGADFDLGECLSAPVQATLDDLMRQIEYEIQGWL